MPECPRDASKLVKLADGLAVIYVCADDSGVWVPAKSLKAFTKRSQKSMAADTAIALAFGAPKDGRARCPEDGVAMGLRTHGGTTIDLCPHCGGVWGPSGKRDGADFRFHPHDAGLIAQIAR